VPRLRAGGLHSHPLRGVFCKNCNTQVELQESRETRGYEDAVLACFDSTTTWNLHIDEKLRRDLPDGSARVKISAHRAPTRSTGGVQSPVRTGNLWSVESSTTSRNHLRCRTWRRARVRAVNLRPTHVAGPASTRGSLVEVETAPPSKLIRIRVLAVRELVQIDPVRQVCDFGRVYAGESVTKHEIFCFGHQLRGNCGWVRGLQEVE